MSHVNPFTTRTLYCPYCGDKVVPGSNFCHSCRRTFKDPLKDPLQISHNTSSYTEIRKPWIAAVLSFIGLGLGQFYNGETTKGLIFSLFFIVILYLGNTFTSFNSVIFIIIIWGIAIFDAYTNSKKINKLSKPYRGKSIFFWIEIIVLIILLGTIIITGTLGGNSNLFNNFFHSQHLSTENQVHVNFTQEDLEKGAMIREQSYILRGRNRHIQFTMFQGVDDYLTTNKPKYYDANNELFWRELINDEVQQKYLDGFIRQIKKETDNRDDQARIAISIVQQIYYDKNLDARFIEYGYYYPYQTMFKDSGACADKSFLLAYILKELGYGVALLKFDPERHVVVGVKAPTQYTYKNTGYAFVDPVCNCMIPTYDKGDYGDDPSNPIYLTSTPIVLKISDGVSFDSIGEEYQDAAEYHRLNQLAQFSHDDYYYIWQPLRQKYGCVQTYPKNVC